MSAEIMLGYAWLKNTITGNVTLMTLGPGGVWRQMAPQHSQIPYYIMAFASGSDWTAFQGQRGYSSLLYQVKVVGPASDTDTLVQAAALLDDTITIADPVTVTGGIIKSCVREMPLEMNEMVEGKHWSNIGGMYRLFVQAIGP